MSDLAIAFLRRYGANTLQHPGGTLLEHSQRVAGTLAGWGAALPLQLAGLCHAAYGTDGFDHPLLAPPDRPVLRAAIGEQAEDLVYRYGACDRGVTYPRLRAAGPVQLRDRFTGVDEPISEQVARALCELTVANELDVLGHSADLAQRYGSSLNRLFADLRPRLSPAAWSAWSAWSACENLSR